MELAPGIELDLNIVHRQQATILIPASDKSFLIEASQQLHSNYSEGNNYQSEAHSTFRVDMDE